MEDSVKNFPNLRNQLLHFTSLMELELDFSDHEELEFANRDELSSLATHIEQVIAQLAHSFQCRKRNQEWHSCSNYRRRRMLENPPY